MYQASVFSQLRKLGVDLEDSDSELRLSTFNLVKDFVYSGDYSNYSNKELFLSIEHRDDKYIAMRLCVTNESVRQIRLRMSREVFSILGNDVITTIKIGSDSQLDSICKSIETLNYVRGNKDYILPDIVYRFKSAYLGDSSLKYDINTCILELIFLSLFSLKRLEKLLDVIDMDKLDYLLRLMNNKVGDASDRLLALKFVTDAETSSDVIKLLKHCDRQIDADVTT